MRNINLYIDVSRNMYICNNVMQYDDVTLVIMVLEESKPYSLDDKTITLNYLKSDNTIVVINNITVIDDTVVVELPRDCTMHTGLNKFELVISKNNKQRTTYPINLNVCKSVLSDNPEASKNTITANEELQQNINTATQTNTTLQDNVTNANTINTELKQAVDNATTANTTLNTTLNNATESINKLDTILNTTTMTELNTRNKTITGAINELNDNKQSKILYGITEPSSSLGNNDDIYYINGLSSNIKI